MNIYCKFKQSQTIHLMDNNKTLLVERRNAELFLRPRFSIDLQEAPEAIISRFSEAFKNKISNCNGVVVDQHIFISVPKKDEHFWSPQLHLEIVEKENHQSELKGLFGPKPQVWTLFMFVHFVVGISFLGFAAMLYSKIALKESFIFPLSMVIFLPLFWVLLYFLGKIGKDTGKKQMESLHNFMIQIINK